VARCCRLRAVPRRRRAVKPLGRARLALLAAAVLSIAVVATGFPTGTLLRQREALAAVSRQLAVVDSHNAAVTSEIASLKQASTIEAIAREEYGLVRPGQRAYVILPGKGARAVGAGMLGVQPIPAADLVPTSVSALAPPVLAVAGAKPTSLWGRTLDELEFWRWVF